MLCYIKNDVYDVDVEILSVHIHTSMLECVCLFVTFSLVADLSILMKDLELASIFYRLV